MHNKKLPFIYWYFRPRASKDISSDLIFDISKSSGIVQIRKLLPMELVYKKFHSEALGNIWNKHHKNFFKICYGS